VSATPAESIDAARTLGLVDLSDREEVRLALRAVLVARREDYDAYDAVFDEMWRFHGREGVARDAAGARSEITSLPRAKQKKSGAVSLQNWMKPDDVSAGDPVRLRAASEQEALGNRDFSDYAVDDDDEFRRLAHAMARRLALRKSRRWKAQQRGERIDLRRTARSSLRTGGDAIRIERRTRKPRRTKIVALCDVSGSMELYSRFLLRFLHALQNSFARMETFVFATRLSRITETLRGVGYHESLRHLGRDVRDWSGGTRIGAAIRTFVDEHIRLVDRRTIVIILSDGWDVGDPAILSDAMRELQRRAGRVIWLNPLMGAADFTPETRGMLAALPYVDVLAPGHNFDSLRLLARKLVV
jgi:uncharacterized protein with von Willebrand factor type A (vWA) domain